MSISQPLCTRSEDSAAYEGHTNNIISCCCVVSFSYALVPVTKQAKSDVLNLVSSMLKSLVKKKNISRFFWFTLETCCSSLSNLRNNKSARHPTQSGSTFDRTLTGTIKSCLKVVGTMLVLGEVLRSMVLESSYNFLHQANQHVIGNDKAQRSPEDHNKWCLFNFVWEIYKACTTGLQFGWLCFYALSYFRIIAFQFNCEQSSLKINRKNEWVDCPVNTNSYMS